MSQVPKAVLTPYGCLLNMTRMGEQKERRAKQGARGWPPGGPQRHLDTQCDQHVLSVGRQFPGHSPGHHGRDWAKGGPYLSWHVFQHMHLCASAGLGEVLCLHLVREGKGWGQRKGRWEGRRLWTRGDAEAAVSLSEEMGLQGAQGGGGWKKRLRNEN